MTQDELYDFIVELSQTNPFNPAVARAIARALEPVVTRKIEEAHDDGYEAGLQARETVYGDSFLSPARVNPTADGGELAEAPF